MNSHEKRRVGGGCGTFGDSRLLLHSRHQTNKQQHKMTYSSIPTAFETKAAAAKFIGMNASTFSKKLKAAKGELVIDGFKISERDEILVYKEIADTTPIEAEVLEPTTEATAQIGEYSHITAYQCEDTFFDSRSELAAHVGCSLSRISELMSLARKSGGTVGKTVLNKYVWVSATLEDLAKEEKRRVKAEKSGNKDADRVERMQSRAAKLVDKINKLRSDLEVLNGKINDVSDTNATIADLLA